MYLFESPTLHFSFFGEKIGGETGTGASNSMNVSPNVFCGKTTSILSWSPPEKNKEKNDKTSSGDSKRTEAEEGHSKPTHVPKGNPEP